METIRQYQAEQQRTKGRTTDLTDVGNLKDFGNWLAFNGASGVVSMAPLMVAAVATGPAAPFVTGALGYGMATGELAGDRINSAQGKLSPQRFSRNPDRYDDALRAENQNVTDYVANTAGSTVGAAIPFAALDVVAGPVGSLLKGAGKEIAQKGVKYAAKEIGKDTLEETATGGLQEVIKIATENALGEQDGILTGENLKRVINSAAAEGAGGMVGGAGRVSYQAVTRPAPTVESQPTTPQAPAVAPGAPVTPDATKTQAVDNIAAAILEAEGGTTQAAPVSPAGEATNAGTEAVQPSQPGATSTAADAVAVDVAGQSEPAKALTQPSNFSATPTAAMGTQTNVQAGPGFTGQGIAAEMAALKARSQTQTAPSQQAQPAQQQQAKPRAKPQPLLNDTERAMLGDFERLYQADVKGEIKTRLGLMPARQDEATAPAEKRKPSELLAAIKNAGGIKSTNAGDLMGGNAVEANRILPGLFTKGGMNMDLLVPFLRDRGYLTQADEDSINDNGGVNKLAEILQAELSGARAQTVDSTTGFEADADNAMRSQLDEKAFALGLPMKVTNEMSTERLNGVINRIERKLGRPVNTDFATRKMTRTEAMAERQAILMADRVERARAQYDADIQAFAEADDAVQDAALDVFIDENGDVVIVNERDADAELAARTLNGSWSDQNGQETATTQDSRTGTDAREVGAPVARGSDQGTQADQGNGTEAGAGQEGLTSYTPSEVTARQDATAQAEATAKRAEEAAARAEAAAKQASEIAQRSVAAADTFELGGNAEDNLSGQMGLKMSRKAKSEADDRNLIIQHNLSADNLLHAVKMGGIAVPSLAVTTKTEPLTGFGEITLIGSVSMADPKG